MPAVVPRFAVGHVHVLGGMGLFQIAGTTKKVGTPSNMPVRRKVRLHNQESGRLLREVWSADGTGVYQFTYIPPGVYYVTAFDHAGEFGGVIETDIVAELMP